MKTEGGSGRHHKGAGAVFLESKEQENKRLSKTYFIVVMAILAVFSINGCSNKVKTAEADKETEEYTAEENTKMAPAPVLSDDIYSFQLKLNGKVYQFPMKYTEFAANGWVYDGDESEHLDSGYIAGTRVFAKEELEVYADIINFDINAKPRSECYIAGISVDNYQLDKAGASAGTAKGIKIGKSTAAEIRAAYGTPGYENTDDSGFTSIEYHIGMYQSIKFSIDSESKKLSKIQIQNYAEPEDFIPGEVSAEVPEAVGRYEAPDAVSNEFADFTVNYSGALYRLPAPVSVFEANGWKIVEGSSDMQAAGCSYGWVTLMKDNQTLKVIANNYSEQATSIRNCFVIKVKSDEFDAKVPITIAKGITIGMSQADLETILSEDGYEKDDSSTLYVIYTVTPVENTLDRYTIAVRKANSKVCKIEMEYTPQYSTFLN